MRSDAGRNAAPPNHPYQRTTRGFEHGSGPLAAKTLTILGFDGNGPRLGVYFLLTVAHTEVQFDALSAVGL